MMEGHEIRAYFEPLFLIWSPWLIGHSSNYSVCFPLGFYMKPKNSHTKHWSIVSDRDRRCLSANGAIAVYICEMCICEMNSDWIICATHLTLHMCTLAQQTHTSPITHKHSQFGMKAVFICERKEPESGCYQLAYSRRTTDTITAFSDRRNTHLLSLSCVFIDTQTQIGRGDFTLQWKHCNLKLLVCCRHDSNTFI